MRLTAQMARWYPEDSLGPHVDVLTLGESGAPPQIPAPLLRVSLGTILDVTVANTLADSTIWLHGLGARPLRFEDSVGVAPGDSVRLIFAANAPGTYTYSALPGQVDRANSERETAAGAFIVDSGGATTDDRVFVINIWSQQLDSMSHPNALAINGRSWPYTERIAATAGDTLRWRVVNASMRPHPMHLHGFYYRIDAKGDGMRDSVVPLAARRSLVTETMTEWSTMAMTWVPEREGHWLFHCHISFHVTPDARLQVPQDSHLPHSSEPGQHMAGLILGIDVAHKPGTTADARLHPRMLRLVAQEGARRARAGRALSFILQQGSRPPSPDSVAAPGSLLVLHVGEPTDIEVVDHLREATAIHWHGIELESYSDGVAGWSGSASRLAPVIAAGDSFVAHLTLRRAGTFMYHTHLNDQEQLTSGLYGPIVVLPTGARFDSSTDHVFLASWDGGDDPPHLLVNGDSVGRPLQLKAGVVHRFRFINIGAAATIRPTLKQDSVAIPWQLTAQDGAELRTPRRLGAREGLEIDVGQTADFIWRAPTAGRYLLSIASAGRGDYFKIPIVVRQSSTR